MGEDQVRRDVDDLPMDHPHTEATENLMNFYIDLDGTVVDASHRSSFLKDQRLTAPQRWSNFFAPHRILRDSPVAGSEIVNDLLSGGHDVTFITGRPERIRSATLQQLSSLYPNYNPEQHPVVMKEDGDYGPTSQWKAERLDELGGDEAVFIDDDELNRRAISDRFQTATVLSPDEGWSFIKGLVQEAGPAPEGTTEVDTNYNAEEDYSQHR